MAFALPASSARCTVPVEAADLPPHIFQHRYRAASQPVVIRNATLRSAADFRAKTTIAALVEAVGDAVVTLSSANAYSYGREKMSVRKYFEHALGPEARVAWAAAADVDGAAPNLFYWFGEHGSEVKSLLSQYPLPRYAKPSTQLAFVAAGGESSLTEPPALSFGVGPDGSGVPFHFHNDGFSEVMHGAKYWMLYPGGRKPPRFRANATSASWLLHDYPKLADGERPMECLIGPGDLLYFPKGWYHAILNVGETVFMSTFL